MKIRILKSILTGIFAALLRAAAFLACLAFLAAGISGFFCISGLRPLIVLSGSMEPAVHTGSLIFINTNKTEAHPGDIITMDISPDRDGSLLVTHRVMGEEDGRLITKGDANDSEDPVRTGREKIVGTYVIQIPYIGYLIVYVKQRLLRFVSG